MSVVTSGTDSLNFGVTLIIGTTSGGMICIMGFRVKNNWETRHRRWLYETHEIVWDPNPGSALLLLLLHPKLHILAYVHNQSTQRS